MSDRWEFPEKTLFGRTDFIALKLENLEYVAQTVEQFHEFFGPQVDIFLRRLLLYGDCKSQ